MKNILFAPNNPKTTNEPIPIFCLNLLLPTPIISSFIIIGLSSFFTSSFCLLVVTFVFLISSVKSFGFNLAKLLSGQGGNTPPPPPPVAP
ncbi:MAG: hypothetical protein ACOVLG_03535 [Flavobacterium sp.]